jgi:tetratricopeptide (TPR) repeat protein
MSRRKRQRARRRLSFRGHAKSECCSLKIRIEANSHYADAYAGRGIVYQIKGDNDDAIADYTKAIEIDPWYANAYVGRGMIYRLKGDSDHAVADFTQAIEINPRYAIAYFNRGSIFETKGERERAIATTFARLQISLRQSRSALRMPMPSIIAASLTERTPKSMRRSPTTPTRLR